MSRFVRQKRLSHPRARATCVALLLIFQMTGNGVLAEPSSHGSISGVNLVFIHDSPDEEYLLDYELVQEYYLTQLSSGTINEVLWVPSLYEARNYLSKLNQQVKSIWLVGHTSPWTGLSMPVFSGGPPADELEINAYINSENFPPLPDNILNRDTVIHIEGCGMGHVPRTLKKLSRLLGGTDKERPQVIAPKEAITFRRNKSGEVVRSLTTYHSFAAIGNRITRRYLASPSLRRSQHRTRDLPELLESGVDDSRVRAYPMHVSLNAATEELRQFDSVKEYLETREEVNAYLKSRNLGIHDLSWTATPLETGTNETIIKGSVQVYILNEAE